MMLNTLIALWAAAPMAHARYFVELGAIMAAVMVLLLIVTVFLRSHKIPECYSCGAMKVRPSRVEGFWAVVATAFMLRPFRCLGCRTRFYALRMSGEAKKLPAQGQRVVKVAFRFRSGLPNRVVIRVVEAHRDPVLHI